MDTIIDNTTPFHPGERAVQERLGVREAIEPFARQMIRPFIPEQHRAFYRQLPFIVAAARDAAGRPWATLLAGEPGFIDSPGPQCLDIRSVLPAGDALADGLEFGADLGLLGIDFASRRRNRVNGRIIARDHGTLRLAVAQSFGNCPQYIHAREWFPAPAERRLAVHHHRGLSAPLRHWIQQADTFFIASGYRDGEASHFGMDASHRGGEPGFVRVLDEHRLVWPDYAGNNHFNTLGNLLRDSRVGMLFVDFAGGHLLQLSGRASIDWDPPGAARSTGAQRLVTVHLDAAVELCDVLRIRWNTTGQALRSLRLLEKRRESADVSSFLLEARDGGPLADFQPGQHLPLAVAIPGREGRVSRSYSLSAAPDGRRYRITVKREPGGLASRCLHDTLKVGDLLSAQAPAGDFTLRAGTRPVVLISAGVGITPMMSMLSALAQSDDEREVWFIHQARDGDHHPFAGEVRELATRHRRIHRHVSYSRPRPADRQGLDFHHRGRIDGDLLAALLPGLDADFYLCGPAVFAAGLRAELTAHGVSDGRIHSESFSGGL